MVLKSSLTNVNVDKTTKTTTYSVISSFYLCSSVKLDLQYGLKVNYEVYIYTSVLDHLAAQC